jgi:hypothetical protein
MIIEAKALEIDKIIFLNVFEHIYFKRVFHLKNMNFENVSLTKVIHFFVILKI